MTILYTTHYMAEAQELSDRVGIVDHGKMIALGTRTSWCRSSARKPTSRCAWTIPRHGSGGARWRRRAVDHHDEDDEAVLLSRRQRGAAAAFRGGRGAARASPRSTSRSRTSRWCSCTSPAAPCREWAPTRPPRREQDLRHRLQGPAQPQPRNIPALAMMLVGAPGAVGAPRLRVRRRRRRVQIAPSRSRS